MAHLWKRVRALGGFLHSRTFSVSMLSVVCAAVVVCITANTNAVYVTNQDGRALHFTMESDPARVLESVGMDAGELDQYSVTNSGNLIRVDELDRLEVTVTADGKTFTSAVDNGTTVGDLLYRNGITFDGNDLLTPNAEKPLSDGDKITLRRVEYEEYTVEEPIPYETVHKNTSLLKLGRTKCIQEGEEGILTKTFVRRTVDGVREDVQLLGKQISRQPVTETILIGSVAPVSGLDFDLDVDENGKPLHYSRVLTQQVATGYSARDGAKTASGRFAMPGHVAVNPNEIPYGSKLYIASADNKFIYGCAVAADTGTGLMQDIVDVDLFYDTYAESVLNGRRIVDIYVLED